MKSKCSADDCERRTHARGMCKMHYKREHYRGNLAPLPLAYASGNVDAFWERVNRTDECWEWTGSRTAAGYGNLRLPSGRNGYAHRVAYELTKGPIRDGLVLDHLCRIRHCVNPDHLEAVPQYENVMRGAIPYGVLRTECKRGHDITAISNVYVSNVGHKRCRKCANQLQKEGRKRDHLRP